ITGGVTLTFPNRILQFLKSKRRRDFNEQLVDALMTMSNALRSGSSILQAFEQIAKQNRNPISQEFSLFLQQTRVGVKFEEALENLNQRVDSEDLMLMVRAIEIARQRGGWADAADSGGGDVRDRSGHDAFFCAFAAGYFHGAGGAGIGNCRRLDDPQDRCD
ncbi:MAG: type II secretion system F family protein, partial [Kiritimatiellia bacterium]